MLKNKRKIKKKHSCARSTKEKKKLETNSLSLGHFYFKKSLVIFNKVKNQ